MRWAFKSLKAHTWWGPSISGRHLNEVLRVGGEAHESSMGKAFPKASRSYRSDLSVERSLWCIPIRSST